MYILLYLKGKQNYYLLMLVNVMLMNMSISSIPNLYLLSNDCLKTFVYILSILIVIIHIGIYLSIVIYINIININCQ